MRGCRTGKVPMNISFYLFLAREMGQYAVLLDYSHVFQCCELSLQVNLLRSIPTGKKRDFFFLGLYKDTSWSVGSIEEVHKLWNAGRKCLRIRQSGRRRRQFPLLIYNLSCIEQTKCFKRKNYVHTYTHKFLHRAVIPETTFCAFSEDRNL
jgi:hypothetical protein